MSFHPTAIVDAGAKIHPSCKIGPYCIVGADVEIAAGTRLMANVYVEGPTWIGPDNIFYPYSTVGVAPQDLKYKGEVAETRIGSRNKIREFVTIHRGTAGGGLVTRIGDDNLLMAYVHIAHDAQVGNGVIMGNGATLAGHVVVEDYAVVGGLAAVHQFCRIGKMAIVGGCSKVVQDVPPFMLADGNPAETRTINKVGLERNGISEEAQAALKQAFRLLFREGLTISNALARLEAELKPCSEIQHLIAFTRASERGISK